MKRLIPILLACFCLTACHKGTTTNNTSATPSANVLDSAIIKCIADYWRQRCHPNERLEDGIFPAQQPDPSGRLYEAWYDVTGYLVLVNLHDTTVADFLENHPIIMIPEYMNLTDSTEMIHICDCRYLTRGDTVIYQEYNNYVLYKYDYYSKEHHSDYDTLLTELSETQYLMADKFVLLSHKDTTIRYYEWSAKSYFNESEYNEQLYWLYKQIIAGDSISDEQLLDLMPKNRDQYRIYDPEYSIFNKRSHIIDSIAISRAKDNPLFRDAYIKMLQWSDAAPADAIMDYYCPRFYFYDSVYFNDAIRRNLPTLYDAIFDDEWYEWNYEHKDEIMNEQ